MLSPTRLGRLSCPTVTSANRHQKKYKVNNPKVSSLSLTGPRNWRQQQRRQWITRNRQCLQGIGDLGITMDSAALLWQAWRIGDHRIGVGRGIWVKGFNDNSRGDNWGSRRYNASEWTSPTAEEPVSLRAQGIDNNDGIVGRVRWAWGLSNDDVGVGRGRGIYDMFKASETTTEVSGARQRPQRLYNDDRGFGRGRWEQILKKWKQRRRQRIYKLSKGLETTTEAAVDWQ